MNDLPIRYLPAIHSKLEAKCKEIGFTMPSDLYTGSLLKTLISSKPQSNILELGTGIGLSLSWMIDGMDAESTLTTIDNDPELTGIAHRFFGSDQRITIICTDGSEWLRNYTGKKFDLIFADAWPGKYSEIEIVLDLLQVGGFYVIDDMSPQPNWPEGHQQQVDRLLNYLDARRDFHLTRMNWSTGVVLAVKNDQTRYRRPIK